MRNLLSALIMLLICGLVVAPGVYAAPGTTYGTTITNTASVDGLNFVIISNSTTTNVQAIVGSGWFGGTDDQGETPGSWVTNLSGLTNYGNTTINFQLTVQDYATAGNSVADWNWEMIIGGSNYMVGAGNAAGFGANVPVAEDGSVSVIFRVQINAGATAATQTWRLAAQSATAYVNPTAYAGNNGTQYGGSVARGWGMEISDRAVMYAAAAGIDTDDCLYSISTSSAPLITISKSIINIVDVSGGGAIAIPGARITYQIRVSNSLAAGPATGVIVRDYVTDPNVTYDAGSQASAGDNAWSTYVNGSTLTWSNTDVSGIMSPGDVDLLSFTVVID